MAGIFSAILGIFGGGSGIKRLPEEVEGMEFESLDSYQDRGWYLGQNVEPGGDKITIFWKEKKPLAKPQALYHVPMKGVITMPPGVSGNLRPVVMALQGSNGGTRKLDFINSQLSGIIKSLSMAREMDAMDKEAALDLAKFERDRKTVDIREAQKLMGRQKNGDKDEAWEGDEYD